MTEAQTEGGREKFQSRSFEQAYEASLRKASREIVETIATPLQKELLHEHDLLLALTSLPPTLSDAKLDPMGIIIGTAQGIYIADEALRLARRAEKDNWGDNFVFIVSGGIGVSQGEVKATGIKGVNARVISTYLTESGISEGSIAVDNDSLNTPQQAKNISRIVEERGISSAVAVVAPWHGPRFTLTMINAMPNLDFYTRYASRDRRRIMQAPRDMGQIDFQPGLFISEIARLHMYVENNSGPLHPQDLFPHIAKLIPERRRGLLERRKKLYDEFMDSWDKVHSQVVDKETFISLSDLARPSGDFKR